MQTIARANWVFQRKQAGEIIDYVGVFRNLQEALALYGSGSGGGIEPGDLPVEAKEKQAEDLNEMLAEIAQHAADHDVDLHQGIGVAGFDWVGWLSEAADKILESDDIRRRSSAASASAVFEHVSRHTTATASPTTRCRPDGECRH